MRNIGLATIVAASLSGCGLSPQPDCVEGRDACCPAWSTQVEGQCEPRYWSEARLFGEGVVEPYVSVAHDGSVALAWLESDGETIGLHAATEGSAFAVVEPPTITGAVTSEPRVAARAGGAMDVVWRDVTRDPPSIRYGRCGVECSWRPEPLSFGLNGNEAEVIASQSGEVLVVWNQWTGSNWGIAVARSVGDERLIRPANLFDVLSPAVNFSNNPAVVLNPDGEAAITWFQDAGDGLMTFVSERAPGSTHFTHPSRADVVSPLNADVDNPVLALSARGELSVAWRQDLGDGTYALLVAHRDAEGRWQRPASLEERVTPPAEVVYRVQLAYVGDDLYLVWQQRLGDDKGVFVMHRDGNGAWLTPPGEPLRLSTPSVDSFDPAVAGGHRGVVVSWTEHDGDDARVVARRGAPGLEGDEAGRWGSATRLSSPGTLAGGSVMAVSGPGDRVACVWTEDGRGALATID